MSRSIHTADDGVPHGDTGATRGAEPRRWLAHLRAVGTMVAAGCVTAGLYYFQLRSNTRMGWSLLLAAVVVGFAAQLGVRFPVDEPAPPPLPASLRRRVLGLLLALAGAALWGFSTLRLYQAWTVEFDNAWLGWTAAMVLLAVGLDLASGVWPRPPERRRRMIIFVAMAVLLVIAGVYRLGNIRDFPGEAAITQIEDLQVGNFGWAYLHGYRLRWEYLSSTWLAALGLWLGGPSQFAMRVPFAVVSTLKVLPLFVWLRLSVGTAGALVGGALLAGSFWDVMLSRIPNNHNTLIVSIVFALLAGPVRRGRPSAYVLLGYLGGYILHEYVAYRPLAVIAVVGAVVWSLRDASAPWGLRLARPLVTVMLLGTMVMPLFLVRLGHTFNLEYLDGWNRARGITGYYNPEDTWAVSLGRRIERAKVAGELFAYLGDRSPVRNVPEQPPLIDPVACGLLVLGIAAALAHLLQPVLALTLAGFVVTVSGTLILTGNFDVARVGGAVAYVYALVGFGAAGLYAAWSQAWGRPGRVLAALLLAVAVAGGALWSTNNLMELWTNPEVRRAHRNDLAYLTIWMRQHVGPDENVLGIAPGYVNALEGHDGSWLRGRPMSGFVAWDVESALRAWPRQPGPTVLFIFAGRATSAVAEFLASRFPELEFHIDRDPLELQADVAYAHVPGPPPELPERLRDWPCRGARGEFAIVGPDAGEVQLKVDLVAPFISRSTWPAAIPDRLYRTPRRPTGIRVSFSSDFTVQTAGDYRFALDMYAGNGTLTIDGKTRDIYAHVPVPLTAGLHHLEVAADFAPMALEPGIELRWNGPDTQDRAELMPLYRLATPDPSCAADMGASPPATNPPFLSDWLLLGPFQPDEGTGRLDVAQLSAATVPDGGGRRWTPTAGRDAFVNLARAFAAQSDKPRSTCAYAVTQVDAPDAGGAALQLAGSGDDLQVWLNGDELTAGPLPFSYQLMRRAVQLRAGPNVLVVKSCQGSEAWYFVARLTAPDGGTIPDLPVHPALPAAPIRSELPPERPLQLIDGLSSVLTATHDGPFTDHRGGSRSWWTYVDDAQPRLTWRTAPVAEAVRTVAVLTASTSRDPGEAELSVRGRPVLHFHIGGDGPEAPSAAGGFRARFIERGFYEGRSGVLLIEVPAEAVTPGEPLELTVTLSGTAPRAWLMLKEHPDTIAHEQLTPEQVNTLLHGVWEPVAQ